MLFFLTGSKFPDPSPRNGHLSWLRANLFGQTHYGVIPLVAGYGFVMPFCILKKKRCKYLRNFQDFGTGHALACVFMV